ncbi:MAG: acyl-phosphate glycerol 3-phosphate acyltransferase [Anaerolinea sp.]|nr:acyl-phosphate glycerol 3-phosphate acyltransferase [Anaerolinea sp.]
MLDSEHGGPARPPGGRNTVDATILRVLLVISAYLSGSIPVGVIVARLSGGPDPRSIGSGRTGGTNALRALGRRWAALVVAGDLAKGAIPVLAARLLTDGDPGIEVLTAFAAVVGSSRSAFLRFGGGRGVGTGVGTMLVIQPIAVVIAAPVFFLAIVITRYVSLGSLLGSAAILPAMLLIWAVASGAVPPAYLAWAVVGPALIWLAHADNINRLLHGTERKFDLGLLGGRRGGGAA